MNRSCLLCGVGGQGTVLASKLIAEAAIARKENVISAETIGMAQRGGSVVSHVRIGDKAYSPLIPKKNADIIIGFEPGEAVRAIDYLKEDGVVIISKKAIMPVTASLGGSNYNGTEMIDYLREKVNRVIVIDGEEICNKCGSSKVLNVALLGAAVASGKLLISKEEIIEALKKRLPEKLHSLNINALEMGMNAIDK